MPRNNSNFRKAWRKERADARAAAKAERDQKKADALAAFQEEAAK